MRNMATGFFILYSLLAGVVGIATSLTGLQSLNEPNFPNLQAAAASSMTSLSLTLLATGLACKEIQFEWTDSNLDIGGCDNNSKWDSMVCTGAINAGLNRKCCFN